MVYEASPLIGLKAILKPENYGSNALTKKMARMYILMNMISTLEHPRTVA